MAKVLTVEADHVLINGNTFKPGETILVKALNVEITNNRFENKKPSLVISRAY